MTHAMHNSNTPQQIQFMTQLAKHSTDLKKRNTLQVIDEKMRSFHKSAKFDKASYQNNNDDPY